MNDFLTKLTQLFPKDKRILLPLIPLVLFVLLVMFVISLVFTPTQPSPNEEIEIPIPTQANTDNLPTSTPTESTSVPQEDSGTPLHGEVALYEESSTLEKKETLSDGSIKYYLSSNTEGRPDVIIARGEAQDTIFQRSVIPQTGTPILLSEYLDFFGEPERIIPGSRFYGPEAQTYLYAQSRGTAYIANPQTNRVLELHTFAPMSIEQYIQKFGEDIASNPNP
jgi:hypothetical protein